MNNCEKYLGLPMTSGKSKVNTFKEMHDWINKKVMGWKEKLISKAGREMLIKTISQAILIYSMSLFKIPKAIKDSINTTLAKYWWGQTNDEKKIYWINWKKLCTQKKKWGMGFRDIHVFNLAMLAKQAGDWHTIHIHCFIGFIRYFSSCSFMEAELGYKSSYVWRSLLVARDVIIEGTRWRVGNGTKIEVSSSR